MWFARLRRRVRPRARIIHPDGRVTECVLLLDTIKPPPFGSEHVAVIVTPFNVAFRKGIDRVEIDWLPPRTFVRLRSLTYSSQHDDDQAGSDAS